MTMMASYKQSIRKVYIIMARPLSALTMVNIYIYKLSILNYEYNTSDTHAVG